MTHKKTASTDPYKAYQDISGDDNASPEAIGDAWRAVEAYAKTNPTSASAKALSGSKADWKKYSQDAPKRDAADKAWTANLEGNAQKFNVGVDVAKMVGKSITRSVENTANRIQQDPVTAIGSRLANFGSDIASSVANIGANASNALFDTNLPNVQGAKLRENYDGGLTFVGGRQNLNPDKGTPQSLGVVVPGHPLESLGRGLEVAGLIPGVGRGARAAGNLTKSAIKKVASDGITEGLTAGARTMGAATAKKVAPVVLAASILSPSNVAADVSHSSLRQVAGVSRSFEAATGATKGINPSTGELTLRAGDTLESTSSAAAHDIPDAVGAAMKEKGGTPINAPHINAGDRAQDAAQNTVDQYQSQQNQNQNQQQASSSTSGNSQNRAKPNEKNKSKNPHAINSIAGSSYGAQEAEIPRIY